MIEMLQHDKAQWAYAKKKRKEEQWLEDQLNGLQPFKWKHWF